MAISIKITRKELLAHDPCEEGVRDFDALVRAQGRKHSLYFREWTPLHAVYACKSRWGVWLLVEGLLPIPQLARADLVGADLVGADLRGADLVGADLRGANLEGADLRGADLRGANLEGADLRGADLRGADLRGADLRGANLERANLRGADLWGANLLAVLHDAYTRWPEGLPTPVGT